MMIRQGKNHLAGDKFIGHAVHVFSYFDLILTQLKVDSKESFSNALFLFKKISENLKPDNFTIRNQSGEISNNLFSQDLQSCTLRLSEIIVLLQFEDTLDQKFDHISQINHIVIDDLQHNERLVNDSKTLLLNKTIQLNSAQLDFIKKEYEEVTKSLKFKLEDIYKASANILTAIEKQEQGKKMLLNSNILKIESSMKLIRSFIDSDIVKFTYKVEALIKIYEVLDLRIFVTSEEKIQGFDLIQLVNIYTIESERMVFKKVFNWMSDFEKVSSESDSKVDFF